MFTFNSFCWIVLSCSAMAKFIDDSNNTWRDAISAMRDLFRGVRK